jgi:hypothetical protein
MRTIWKFPLKTTDDQNVVGHGTRIVSAGLDPDGVLCAWAEVDGDEPVVVVEIAIRGTGHALPAKNFEFVATVRDGSFMWHVFAAHTRAGK